MTKIEGDMLPRLVGERVVLRWLEDADVAGLFAMYSDAETMRYWSTGPWVGEVDGVELLKGVRKGFAEGSLYQWGLVLKDDGGLGDGELIGTCTLCGVDHQNRRAEIGFMLRRDRWGNGLMREALEVLLGFAFGDGDGELGLHRVEADVDPRNAGSIGLLERLGFLREGYLRERWIVEGEVADTVLYGLLGREWEGG